MPSRGRLLSISVRAPLMLHGTIGNDDLKRNAALQHCCDIISNGCNIVPTLLVVLRSNRKRSVTSRYHGSTVSGWQQNQRRRQGERQKIIMFYFNKQQLCTCITLFGTFLCRCCTTTTWNFLVSRAHFIRWHNAKTVPLITKDTVPKKILPRFAILNEIE